jgi:hypothetical protein
MTIKETAAHLLRLGAQELNDLAAELEAQAPGKLKVMPLSGGGDGDNDADDGGIGQDNPTNPNDV